MPNFRAGYFENVKNVEFADPRNKLVKTIYVKQKILQCFFIFCIQRHGIVLHNTPPSNYFFLGLNS